MIPPSTAPLIKKKALFPFILITSLFALWGFANSVTDPMVQAFKKVLELSNTEASWVQMAFYGGYFCMALPAAIFVRRFSYKAGILTGLGLYAAGALLFYPAANTEQFWFFCLGLYIITFGLAFLETVANPYILSMGDERTATQRLNLAQAFNPLGLIAGLLVAQNFILKKLQSNDIENFRQLDGPQKMLIRTSDLMLIRDPYVVLGLVVIGFFIIIAISKMPQAKNDTLPPIKETFKKLFKNKKYVFGVFSQVLYIGAQIMCWTYIYQYAEAIGVPPETAANYQFAAFVVFLGGRAIGTYLLRRTGPGKLLMLFAFFGAGSVLGTISIEGMSGLYFLVSTSFFLSIIFPTIYGISLSGLKDDDAKIGAAGLVMAIVGGALLPALQGMIIDLGGVAVDDIKILGVPEVNFSFILPFFCFIAIGMFGKYVAGNKFKQQVT